MTRLEWFEQGIKLKTIGRRVKRYEVYKCYMQFLSAGLSIPKARMEAASELECDISTVSRAISFFEKFA